MLMFSREKHRVSEDGRATRDGSGVGAGDTGMEGTEWKKWFGKGGWYRRGRRGDLWLDPIGLYRIYRYV